MTETGPSVTQGCANGSAADADGAARHPANALSAIANRSFDAGERLAGLPPTRPGTLAGVPGCVHGRSGAEDRHEQAAGDLGQALLVVEREGALLDQREGDAEPDEQLGRLLDLDRPDHPGALR